jgi:hypothetical protein
MVEAMQPEIEDMTLEAEQALEGLLSERLIPFKLSARVVESMGHGEYIVRFHDSRLRSVDVSWRAGQSFKTLVRAAVLDRVSRMSGPLKNIRAA